MLTPKDAARACHGSLLLSDPQKDPLKKASIIRCKKMAYTGVFLVLTPLIMLSGMAMSPQLDTAFHWLPAMFGGRQSARSIHFILAFAFSVGFTFGHVFMVLTTGVLNNMRSIVTGWYKETGIETSEPARPQDSGGNDSKIPPDVPLSQTIAFPELEEASPARETDPPHIDAAHRPDSSVSESRNPRRANSTRESS